MRDMTLYIKDILDAMESIESFILDMDFQAFQNDDKTSSAVIRKLEIIEQPNKYRTQLETNQAKFLGKKWLVCVTV